MTLYEILGVSADATPATIKTAFRMLAMLHHPDRGGEKETMQKVQHAYDVLSDVGRRERYDTSGDTAPPIDRARQKMVEQLSGLLRGLFDSAGDKVDAFTYDDPLVALRRHLHKLKGAGAQAQAGVTRKIELREKMLARLSVRKGGDLLSSIIEGDIAGLRGMLEANEVELQSIHDALEVLTLYEYEVAERPKPNPKDLAAYMWLDPTGVI